MTTFDPDREHPRGTKPLIYKGFRADFFGSK
jgi:hypothetical protein